MLFFHAILLLTTTFQSINTQSGIQYYPGIISDPVIAYTQRVPLQQKSQEYNLPMAQRTELQERNIEFQASNEGLQTHNAGTQNTLPQTRQNRPANQMQTKQNSGTSNGPVQTTIRRPSGEDTIPIDTTTRDTRHRTESGQFTIQRSPVPEQNVYRAVDGQILGIIRSGNGDNHPEQAMIQPASTPRLFISRLVTTSKPIKIDTQNYATYHDRTTGVPISRNFAGSHSSNLPVTGNRNANGVTGVTTDHDSAPDVPTLRNFAGSHSSNLPVTGNRNANGVTGAGKHENKGILKTKSNIPITSAVSLDERSSFDGDQCATGYVRVHGICVLPD